MPSWFSLGPLLVILGLIDIVLRGLALWRSAKANQNYWFIALLVVNSLGLLPLFYLLTHKSKVTKVSGVKKSTKK